MPVLAKLATSLNRRDEEPNYKPEMARILTQRLPDVEQDTKRKRLTGVLQKLQK